MTVRYSKQIKLQEFGVEGQKKLSNASLLVIGAGGLGCSVLQYLTAAGIGRLGIMDFDTVEESNLPRQVLYTTADIGKQKAESAAMRLKEMNPHVDIEVYPQKLTLENAASIIEKYSIIADCTDNFTARYIINDACVRLNKPWVFASLEAWQGQVSVFNYNNGPTYRCIFPEAPLDALNCDDIGMTGPVASIVASVQANEVLKCITGIGKILNGKLWIADLLNNTFSEIEFRRNENAIKKMMKTEGSVKPSARHHMDVNVEDFISSSSDYILVDIREKHEFEMEPSDGENIPFDELMRTLGRINTNQRYMLLCKEGRKSLFLAYHLKEKYDINNIYSLDGGWEKLKTVVKL